MKMFKEFTGIAKPDFRDRMVKYWIWNEGYATKEEALDAYGGEEFDALCCLVIGSELKYKPDLGYECEKIEGTLCFEVTDNNFVIPVTCISNKIEI